MKIEDFESKIFENGISDEELKELILLDKKLERRKIDLRVEEKIELNNYSTENISDYLEANLNIVEMENNIIGRYFSKIVEIAFDYYISGVDFFDLIQEGTIALIERADDDLSENVSELLIRINMLLFIRNKVENEKNMYLSYLEENRDEIVKSLLKDKHIEIQEAENLVNEKIRRLKNLKLEFLSKKISKLEETVLKFYYGVGVEKRYSIFEIEDELGLERGEGEEVFKNALVKLSLIGGKTVLL